MVAKKKRTTSNSTNSTTSSLDSSTITHSNTLNDDSVPKVIQDDSLMADPQLLHNHESNQPDITHHIDTNHNNDVENNNNNNNDDDNNNIDDDNDHKNEKLSNSITNSIDEEKTHDDHQEKKEKSDQNMTDHSNSTNEMSTNIENDNKNPQSLNEDSQNTQKQSNPSISQQNTHQTTKSPIYPSSPYTQDSLVIVNKMNSLRLTCGPLNTKECVDERLENVFELASCMSLHMPRVLQNQINITESSNDDSNDIDRNDSCNNNSNNHMIKYAILDLEFLSHENHQSAKDKLHEIFGDVPRINIVSWPSDKIYFNNYEYLNADPDVLLRFKHSMLVAGYHKLRETWAVVRYLDDDITNEDLLQHFPSAIYSFRPDPSKFYVRMDTREAVQKIVEKTINIKNRNFKIKALSLPGGPGGTFQHYNNYYGSSSKYYYQNDWRHQNNPHSNYYANQYHNQTSYYNNRNNSSFASNPNSPFGTNVNNNINNNNNSQYYRTSPMQQQMATAAAQNQYHAGPPNHPGMIYNNYPQPMMPSGPYGSHQNQHNTYGMNYSPMNPNQNAFAKRGAMYYNNASSSSTNYGAKRPNF